MEFIYEVLDQKGESLKGAVEASTKEGAIRTLQDKGYTILSLGQKKSIFQIKLFQRVRQEDLVIFCREVATLFKADITALRAFKLVASQSTNPYLQEILTFVTEDIQKGSTIAKSLSKYPNVFDDFFINIVNVGEESGTLSRSFEYLTAYLERSYKTRQKVKHALTYPIFVIVTFFAVMILMFVTVIPQISTILIDAGADLPTITKVVIGISDVLKEYGYALLAGVIGLFLIGYKYVSTAQGRRDFDSFKLRVPLFGTLFRKSYLTQMTDNMSVMLASGVPMLRALSSVRGVIKNEIFRDSLADIEAQVKRGVPLSSALESHPIVGDGVHQLVRVGEESGEVSEILRTLASFYEQETESTVDTLVDLIQPVIIVFLGLGVGLIISSVLLPIYSLASAI